MGTKNPKKTPGMVKAYNNYEFLNSPPARNIRILSEMVEPTTRLARHRVWNTVVFFGSARIPSKKAAQKRLSETELQIKKSKKTTPKMKDDLKTAMHALTMSRYYEDACLLAQKMTRWFYQPKNKEKKFRICSGGGPGIMEAANLGASRANGESIGLNISLPLEQQPNPYQTKEISFEFHYFFIRKFWFFYLAKALVVFPGGFGTMDELFELLTLIQTKKSRKHMPVVLYGSEYWKNIVNFEGMIQWGTIDRSDLELFHICDDVESAFEYLKKELKNHFPK